MPTSNSVKYRFGLNERGETVDINSLSKSEKKKEDKFTCVNCGRVLYPVMGIKKQKHFRHESDEAEQECNSETYLHKLAKQVFYDTYSRCLEKKIPFYVEYDRISCNHFKKYGENCKLKDPNPIKYDLTETFTEISIEKKVGEFRPDILLRSGDGDSIFIEIVVTNKSSESKRSSGYKIIELYIENESDILTIPGHHLKETEKIAFANFPVDESDYCGGDCQGQYLDYSLCEQAQRAFCETYLKCYREKRPFLVKFRQQITCNHYFNIDKSFKKCNLGTEIKSYDLTKIFGNNIFNFDREDIFAPLWLQSRSGDKLFIETVVNSKKTYERNYYSERNNSRERTIQLYIQDESDVQIINEAQLCESEKIKFLNFLDRYEGDACGGDCECGQSTQNDCKYNVFIVYKSGKAILLTDLTFDEVEDKKNTHPLKIEYIGSSELTEKYSYNIDEVKQKQLYIKKVIKSYHEKIKIKNCYLCRYHANNKYSYYNDESIFCKFLKETGKSTMAAECEYYRPDEKAFPTPDAPHKVKIDRGGTAIELGSQKDGFKDTTIEEPPASFTNGDKIPVDTGGGLISHPGGEREKSRELKPDVTAEGLSEEKFVHNVTVYHQNENGDSEKTANTFDFNRRPNIELIPENLQQVWKSILAHLPKEAINLFHSYAVLKYYDEITGIMIVQLFYYRPSMDKYLQSLGDACRKSLLTSSIKIFAEIYDDNLFKTWERILQILSIDVREFFTEYGVLRQYSELDSELTIMLYQNFDFDRAIIDIYTGALLEQCKLFFNTENVLVKIKFLDSELIIEY